MLAEWRPEFVLVLGRRLWHHLPDDGGPGPSMSGAPYPETWLYRVANRSKAVAFSVRHPGRAFNGRTWHPHVMKALQLNAV